MPMVVAGAALAGVAGGFTIGAGGALVFGFSWTAFAGSLVLGGLSHAMQKKPPSAAGGAGRSASFARDRTLSLRQPVAPRRVVYGRGRLGGTIVFVETTGSSNQTLHLVIALAGHRVQAIGNPYFDGEEVELDGNGDATGRWAGKVFCARKLGTADQTAFTGLGAKWTSAHRLRGVACACLRLTWDNDLFPGGLPAISFDLEGRDEVFDPRTQTTGYSENAALCLADYLASGFGLGAAYGDEIDENDLIEAANVCDEAVTLVEGGTEPRYACNGSLETNEAPYRAIEDMLSAMAGQAVWSGGVWRIRAGAWRVPEDGVLTVDAVRAGLGLRTRVSRRENFNAIKGVFVSPDNDWQPDDFPAVTKQLWLDEDQGQRVWKDIELKFTISAATAQRIARIELERARRQETLSWPGKLSAWRFVPADTVSVDIARYGFEEKTFEVRSTRFVVEDDMALGCDLVLRASDANVYAWSPGEDENIYAPAPRTTLPSPFFVAAPTSVSVQAEEIPTRAGDITFKLLVTWTGPADAFVDSGGRIELQFKLAAASDWRPSLMIDGAQTFAEIYQVEQGEVYDLRVRAWNGIGVRSAWQTISDFTVTDGGGVAFAENWGRVADPAVSFDAWGSVADAATVFEDWGA